MIKIRKEQIKFFKESWNCLTMCKYFSLCDFKEDNTHITDDFMSYKPAYVCYPTEIKDCLLIKEELMKKSIRKE